MYIPSSICTQRIFLFLLYQTYLSYTPGQISRIISTNCTLIFTMIFSLSNAISVCTNTIGMSNVITSLLLFLSIILVAMIDSDAAVRLVASLIEIQACCVLPLAHIMALIVSYIFLFNKIRIPIALFLSSLVILLMPNVSKTT